MEKWCSNGEEFSLLTVWARNLNSYFPAIWVWHHMTLDDFSWTDPLTNTFPLFVFVVKISFFLVACNSDYPISPLWFKSGNKSNAIRYSRILSICHLPLSRNGQLLVVQKKIAIHLKWLYIHFLHCIEMCCRDWAGIYFCSGMAVIGEKVIFHLECTYLRNSPPSVLALHLPAFQQLMFIIQLVS